MRKIVRTLSVGLALIAVAITVGCESDNDSSDSPNPDMLPPPTIVSPLPGAVVSNATHLVQFNWQAVTGAKAYTVQLEAAEPDWMLQDLESVATNTCAITVASTNRVRWKVWAISRSDMPGQQSGWVEFRVTP